MVGGDIFCGYSQGKYWGCRPVAHFTWSEYRVPVNFYRNRGVVAFMYPSPRWYKFSDISTNKLLPGVGAGLRYRMLTSEKGLNIGVDAGIGKGDYSITFRIGEAFGR